MGKKKPGAGKIAAPKTAARREVPKTPRQPKGAAKESPRTSPAPTPQPPAATPAHPPASTPAVQARPNSSVASIPTNKLVATSAAPLPGLAGLPLVALASTGPGRASAAGPKAGVVVIGSLNMDLVIRTEVMPTPGQTVMGQDLLQNAGGKGGNQAAAIGHLWQKRTAGSKIIARVGDDVFGQNILAALQKARVDTSSVMTTRHSPTGTAMILVDRHGENAIVVSGGANRDLAATDLLAQRKTIESSVVLLAQLECPADTIACGFALAKRSGVLTMLDPAPAPPEGIPESLYHVDIFMPNQTEAQLLSGILVRTLDDARRDAERFLMRGTRIVVIKMGSQGAAIIFREGTNLIAHHVPGFRVPVTDTTAAGDAFAGALAVALAEGMPLAHAVRFANAAGAMACTKLGAMAAMPSRADVERMLAEA